MKRSASPARGATKSPAKPQAPSKPKPKVKARPAAKSAAKAAPKPDVKKSATKPAAKAKSAAKKLVKKISSVATSKNKAAAKAAPKAAPKKSSPSLKATAAAVAKKVKAGVKAALKKITPVKKAAPKVKAAAPAKAAVKPVAKPAAKPAAPKAKIPVKAPSKTVRPKSFPARPAEKPYGFSADTPELPESYGEDRLVLMTQDPEVLFTYWEITPEQLALSEQAKRAGEEYQEALRLNWIARDLFAPNFALLPVSLKARKGYLHVPFSGLSYQVEIGWVSEQGHFISILGRSNRSDAPESWQQTRARLKSAAGERTVLEYNLRITQPLGSSELGRTGHAVESSRVASDWDFEGPGSLSSSASSGSVVRKTPKPRG